MIDSDNNDGWQQWMATMDGNGNNDGWLWQWMAMMDDNGDNNGWQRWTAKAKAITMMDGKDKDGGLRCQRQQR